MKNAIKSQLAIGTLAVLSAGFLAYQVYDIVLAQTCAPGTCPGAISALPVTGGYNVGIGTSTPATNARLFVYSTTTNTYAISASGTINIATGALRFPDGTTQSTAFSGTSQTLTAANVSAGAFGSNTGGGNYSFPANISIGTSTVSGRLNVSGGNLTIDKDNGIVGDGFNAGGRNRIWALSSTYPDRGISYYEGTPDYISIHPAGTTSVLAVTDTGRVGVGTVAPDTTFHVNGGTGGWGIFERGGKQLYVNANYSGGGSYSQLANRNTDNMGLSLSSKDTNPEYLFVSTGGSVGIGTTSPTATLDVNGSMELTGVSREGTSATKVFRNLTSYYYNGGNATGAIVIQTSIPNAANIMMQIKVEGYTYNTSAPFDITVGGYAYSAPNFVNVGYTNIGSFKPMVRWGRNTATGNAVLILGDVDTVWPYPRIWVSQFVGGYGTVTDAYGDGWSTSLTTSLAAYDTLVTVPDRTSINTSGVSAANVSAGTFGSAVGNGNFSFPGNIAGIGGYTPTNNAIRMTPNLHLNSMGGSAVIANWDNGTTGTAQTFRVGNGAAADAFYVRADGAMFASNFFDINDSAYYVNPNGGSNVLTITASEMYANGWFRNNADSTGLYNQFNDDHIYSQGAYWNFNSANGLLLRAGYGGAAMGYVYTDGSNFGLLGSAGSWAVQIPNGGNAVNIGGTLTVGGGTGKINVGTVDPIYTIGGKKYATYLPGMTGQKEETTGTISCRASNGVCKKEIDFRSLRTGSDLWLFAKAANLVKNADNFQKMTVLLTPAFDGRAWYVRNAADKKITIYAEGEGDDLEVSYRLTAPRFDSDELTNYSNAKDEGFNLDKLIK